jgi:hypothetical protein
LRGQETAAFTAVRPIREAMMTLNAAIMLKGAN